MGINGISSLFQPPFPVTGFPCGEIVSPYTIQSRVMLRRAKMLALDRMLPGDNRYPTGKPLGLRWYCLCS